MKGSALFPFTHFSFFLFVSKKEEKCRKESGKIKKQKQNKIGRGAERKNKLRDKELVKARRKEKLGESTKKKQPKRKKLKKDFGQKNRAQKRKRELH